MELHQKGAHIADFRPVSSRRRRSRTGGPQPEQLGCFSFRKSPHAGLGSGSESGRLTTRKLSSKHVGTSLRKGFFVFLAVGEVIAGAGRGNVKIVGGEGGEVAKFGSFFGFF